MVSVLGCVHSPMETGHEFVRNGVKVEVPEGQALCRYCRRLIKQYMFFTFVIPDWCLIDNSDRIGWRMGVME